MPDEMTLPITPQTFWITTLIAAVVVLSALIYWMLRAMGQERRPPLWEELPERVQGVTVVLGLLWLGLFGLTIVAAYLGVWEAIHPKDAGSQPNLGLGALLAALLGSPFVIWGTWLKYQTVRTQQGGHMTDRISKAVEQLGAEKTVKAQGKDSEGKDVTFEETKPNIEVRIGAILSLERIAQDSTKYSNGRDHVRVMEILCAYVRENSKAKDLNQTPTPFNTRKPRLDIQKAIDVIKRRSSEQVALETFARYRLDLRDTDLDGCDLSKGEFSGAIFWRSRFEASDIRLANLTGAQMQNCLLNHALFVDAILKGTNLNFAILNVRINLGISVAKLDGVFVEGADIQGLNISKHNAELIFGSSDTRVAFGQNEDQRQGLEAADKIHLDEIVRDGERLWPADKEIGDGARNYLHWNPYTSNDLASGEFRAKYRLKRGLIGWPFDD